MTTPVEPTDEALAQRETALAAKIASQRPVVDNAAWRYLDSKQTTDYVASRNSYVLDLDGQTTYQQRHLREIRAEYMHYQVLAMQGAYAWRPLLMQSSRYVPGTNNPEQRGVAVFPASDNWRRVLDDALEYSLHTQLRVMRACGWWFSEIDKATGVTPFDYAAAAPDKHAKEQSLFAREQLWAKLARMAYGPAALLEAELDSHQDYVFPEESLWPYLQSRARDELATAIAQRHEDLMGSWLPKTKFVAGSCPTQETALRSLARAYQLALVKIEKATDKAALDAIVAERKTTIAAIHATGSPTWKRADGTSYAPSHGVLAHHFEHTPAAADAARQRIMAVVAESPDASDECAIMEVGNDNAEIETALSVPTNAKQHRIDIYWIANAPLAAGKTYSVRLYARNECGDSRMRIDISSPEPSTD